MISEVVPSMVSQIVEPADADRGREHVVAGDEDPDLAGHFLL
jgi:hypothetical protein